MPPTQYRPSRRNWIKLWTHEWLTGTVRWQLSTKQRSMWADLLALAGDSRFPGIVTPGEDAGKFIGYPLGYFAGLFRCSEKEVSDAFNLFEQQTRIKFGEGREIYIVNWEKYQSEYQEKRQRKQYKQKSAQDHSNVRQNSAPVEPEVEVEVDKKEIRGERENLAHALFEKFWIDYPKKLDKGLAFAEWLTLSPIDWDRAAESVALWAKSEEWADQKFIPAPVSFLKKRRWESRPMAKKSVENLAEKAKEMEARFEKGGR